MTATVPPTRIQPLLRRARGRYACNGETLTKLAYIAAQRVAARDWERDEDRNIAAHVALAAAGARELGPPPGRIPLVAERAVGECDPADRALAEHLHARLAPEVRLAVALRATCAVPPRLAADALQVTVAELRRLEEIARHDAEALTLPYHDDFICEPADLAGLPSSAAVTAAVRQHLSRCRSCRREFADRVWHVLGHAGENCLPLPEFVPSPSGARQRVRRALSRPPAANTPRRRRP
jgi:hypothetical protein